MIYVHKSYSEILVERTHYKPTKADLKLIEEGARVWPISTNAEAEALILKRVPLSGRTPETVPLTYDEQEEAKRIEQLTKDETAKFMQAMTQQATQLAVSKLIEV